MELFQGIEAPLGVFGVILALCVVFLNGFTDAPNSIATAVSTKALSMNKACTMCALFNLFGLVIMYFINDKVARALTQLSSFGENGDKALFIVLLSVVIFTIFTWALGIPSSESHAIVASIAGVGLAIQGSINVTLFFYIILSMLLSCVASAGVSLVFSRCLKNAFLPYDKLQVLTCAFSSFMHGAQDGQKLLGILLLISPKSQNNSHIVPLLLVGIPLFLGTLLGGGRITRLMGEKIARLTQKSAFVSDISSSLTALVCSLLGAPVSTSNIKAVSVATSALCEGKRPSTKALVKIAYVAILTFPICIALSFVLSRLIL